MTYTLIYYGSCSNCRNGLALLREAGVEPVLREYMKDQLSVDELKDIAAKMGNVSPRAFLRDKTAREAGLSETASDEDVFAAMADNPKLIQRPIGIKGDKAVLGRPNDALLTLL
ncbi:MAG: arsenate reductase [Alphaproteobacteria bacterium]|nr:arsenate reductase [Alphaproteobacteria bacterium]